VLCLSFSFCLLFIFWIGEKILGADMTWNSNLRHQRPSLDIILKYANLVARVPITCWLPRVNLYIKQP
jgi:hypothetical protein